MTKHRMFEAPNLRQLNFFTQPLVVMVETFRMSDAEDEAGQEAVGAGGRGGEELHHHVGVEAATKAMERWDPYAEGEAKGVRGKSCGSSTSRPRAGSGSRKEATTS